MSLGVQKILSLPIQYGACAAAGGQVAAKRTGSDMTKTTLFIFCAAVLMLVVAAALNLPQLAGTASLLMLSGLVYAFIVMKRDIERSKYVSR